MENLRSKLSELIRVINRHSHFSKEHEYLKPYLDRLLTLQATIDLLDDETPQAGASLPRIPHAKHIHLILHTWESTILEGNSIELQEDLVLLSSIGELVRSTALSHAPERVGLDSLTTQNPPLDPATFAPKHVSLNALQSAANPPPLSPATLATKHTSLTADQSSTRPLPLGQKNLHEWSPPLLNYISDFLSTNPYRYTECGQYLGTKGYQLSTQELRLIWRSLRLLYNSGVAVNNDVDHILGTYMASRPAESVDMLHRWLAQMLVQPTSPRDIQRNMNETHRLIIKGHLVTQMLESRACFCISSRGWVHIPHSYAIPEEWKEVDN